MVQLKRQLFTVEEYYKMAEVGILKPTDRVELINGEIIQMSPIKSPHASTITTLEELLIEQLFKKVTIRSQNPIHISKFSEPEPDVAVFKYRKDRYRKAHPTPKETLLVIEVADSSLHYDRQTKTSLYAEALIPEYWIINLQDSQIEVFTSPKNGIYLKEFIYRGEEKIIATTIDFSIGVADIFFE